MERKKVTLSTLRTLRMPKYLCMSGVVISILVFAIFLLDLLLGLIARDFAPFKLSNMTFNIVFILCSAALGYLSWVTYKEQE